MFSVGSKNCHILSKLGFQEIKGTSKEAVEILIGIRDMAVKEALESFLDKQLGALFVTEVSVDPKSSGPQDQGKDAACSTFIYENQQFFQVNIYTMKPRSF